MGGSLEIILNLSTSEWIAIISLGVALLVALLGLCEYRNSINVERSKWLYVLYQDFYSRPELKEMRETLDASEGRRYKQLVEILEKEKTALDEADAEERVRFYDYLNFFEFVLRLKEIKSLTDGDIEAMFDYYLRCLEKEEKILRYSEEKGYVLLKQTGYELLSQYLDERKAKRIDKS